MTRPKGPPRTRWTRVEDVIPDVRDGLTRPERIVLWVLSETQKERGGRNVPTAMLYGRVLEHIDMSEADLYDILNRLGAASKDIPTPKP
jgi:hypothetical protein